MAAAIDLVDRAVRTKQVRERTRGKAGGAFAREKLDGEARDALRKRKAEDGKLSEWERSELLYLWSGNSTAIVRSVQGAVEDRLLRAPPRIGAELEQEVVEFLLKRGRGGAPRERLVELLAAENVGATRHEGRLALRRMVGAGRVEFFVEEVERKKPCTCKSSMGEFEGASSGAPGTRRKRGPCTCGSGELERVPCEMVRLAPGKYKRGVPAELPAAERWARADAALEAYCQVMAVSETGKSGGGRLHPPMGKSAEKARVGLARMPPEYARVLERVYASQALPQWAGQLSEDAARLAPLCPAVEKARRELVDAKVSAQGHWGDPAARRAVDRATYAVDAVRQKLDAAPDEEVARARWARERERFVADVERDASRMVADAVSAYRQARG